MVDFKTGNCDIDPSEILVPDDEDSILPPGWVSEGSIPGINLPTDNITGCDGAVKDNCISVTVGAELGEENTYGVNNTIGSIVYSSGIDYGITLATSFGGYENSLQGDSLNYVDFNYEVYRDGILLDTIVDGSSSSGIMMFEDTDIDNAITICIIEINKDAP